MKSLWSSLFFCCAASLSASSGPVWTSPQIFPSSSQNVIFAAYNPNLGKVVATWVNDVTFSPNAIFFSSTFDGSSWSTPLQLPILPNHTTADVLINAYDTAIGKTVVLWADPTISPPQPNSSIFDGTTWSAPQIIPDGGTGALIPIPTFDLGINQLVATWCDFSSPSQGQSSLFDGTNWSAAPIPTPASGALLQFAAPLSNQLVVVWVDFSTPALNGYSSVFDGTSWSPAQFVAGNIAPPNLIPVLNNAYNPQSQTLLVAWVDNTTHQGFSSIFDGSTWSAPQAIPGSSAEGTVFPIYDPALGQIVAIWPDSGTSSGAYSLFDGTNWSAAQEIPGSSSPASSFLASYDPVLGKVIALWTDSSFQGHYSIFYVPSITFLGGGNLKRVANYINSVGQNGAMQPILAKLIGLPQDQLTDALSSISNARNAFLPWTAAETSLSFSGIMEDRFAELRWLSFQGSLPPSSEIGLIASMGDWPMDSTQAAAHQNQTYALWIEGISSFAYQKAQDQNPAYHAQTNGAMLGFDYYGENIRTIASFAYGRSTIHPAQDAGNSNINSFTLAWFGTGSVGDMYFEGGCLGAYNRNHSNRNIVFPGFNAHAKSEFSGWQAVPHFAAGYDFAFKNLILEPFLNVDCAIVFQEAFSEEGAMPLNVRQPSSTAEFLQTQVGLRGYISNSTNWGLWLFRFTAAYQYKKGWDIGTIKDAFFVEFPSTGFTVISLSQAQNAFVPSVEFFLRSNKGIFASLSYNGEFASQYIANSVLGKLGFFW